jgi:hypothetical protein
MGSAMGVMHEFASQTDISGADRARMSKALDSLDGTGVGSIPRNRLAALGAVVGGLKDLVAVRQEAAAAGDVAAHEVVLQAEGDLAKVRGAIVEIGLSLGSCKGELDGARHSGDGSSRLFDSVGLAERCLAECFRDNEAGELLASIAFAILPESWHNAIEERLPAHVVERMRTTGVDPMQLLHSGLSHATEKELQRLLATGHGADAMKAIFALLKVSEYVVGNDPGSAKPASPSNGTGPHTIDPALQELRDIARDSKGGVFYNSCPVEVNNDLSFLKEMLPQQGEPSVPITFVENLLKREDHHREVDFQRGLDIGQRDEYIRHLEDQLRQQVAGGPNVRSRLEAQNNAYSQWVTGSGKLFANSDSPAVDSETTVLTRRDSIQFEKSGLVSSHSDHDSAFGDSEDASAEAESRGDSVRSDQQHGHGSRVPDAEFEKLQNLFPIQRPGAGGETASEHIDDQQDLSALSAQSGDTTPENVSAAESDRDQAELDVTDGVVRRDAYAPVSRDRNSVSQVGEGRGAVEHRAQGNVTASNHRQAGSSGKQPELTDLVEPGSVRKLIRHYESLALEAVRSTAQIATGAVAEPHSEAATASAVRDSRSISDAGAGRVKASSLREGVADTEGLRAFNRLPRAWLDRAGSATRSNEVNSIAPNVPIDQSMRVETDALGASSASTVATADAVGRSGLPISTAQNYVQDEDDMEIQFSGWKTAVLGVGGDSARVPAITTQSAQSGFTGAAVQKDSSASQMFREVQSPSAAMLRNDPITEFRMLVDFRDARGTGVSAVKSQDEFRRHWESVGGLPFAPPVVPVPAGKETFLLREHELEKVFDQMAQNRSRKDNPLLQGIFRKRSDGVPTTQAAAKWAARASDSSPAQVSSAGAEAATATSMSISAVSEDNRTPRAADPHVLAVKREFNSPVEQLLKRYTRPVVNGLKNVS